MNLSSILVSEAEPLETSFELPIADTWVEEDFDDVVLLASQICNTPIANISFNDKRRWWFNTNAEAGYYEILMATSLCDFNLKHLDLLIVEDTFKDKRFANNTAVIGEPNIRFYAGLPIITEEGFIVGSLCVLDKLPRSLSQQQLTALRILAKQVVKQLKTKLQVKSLLEAEERSKSIEQKFKTIFEQTNDAVAIVNINGKIVEWNPKATSLFGWTNDEVMGKPFSETVISPRHRKNYRKGIKDYEESGEEDMLYKPIEMAALHKHYDEFDIALKISPLVIKGKLFFVCFASDITEPALVTAKLEKQKEFYELILNKIPRDVAVFDAQHKYLFVNEGAIKDAELRKFIIGKDDFEYAAYRNRDSTVAEIRRKKFLEVRNSKREIYWEDTIKDPSGKDITHLRRLIPVYNKDEELTMIIGFGIDITERKILKERQVVLVKQLSGQNTQLIDFCNIVSHNLRAPLVNISMLSKYIEESNDVAEQKEMIKMLNPVVDNLHTTFNELVESIQIKQDVEIQSELMCLEECLKRTVEGLEPELRQSETTIDTKFEAAPNIKFPSKYMHSIFHNLVSNAVKYRSPQRKPVIKLETKKVDNTIVFSVSDNGLGIDLKKHHHNCFKIGKVFHSHPNAKGFGLYMTKTQVEAMGGQIWVESTPDVGTTFFIEFINQNECNQ